MIRFVAALAAAFISVSEPIDVHAAQHPCQGALEEQVSKAGLSLTDLKTPAWIPLTRGESGRVVGYQFYAQPIQCEKGRFAISMTRSCFVQTVYTAGACRLDGVHYSPPLFR